MNGPDCPVHHTPMEYGSTTNEWNFVCRACDMRYNAAFERMDSDVNWRIDHDDDQEKESPRHDPSERSRREEP